MPMLEVMMTGLDEVSSDAKQGFANEVAAAFHEVLGTPRARIQLVLRDIAPGDCADVLLALPTEGPSQSKT